MRLYTFMWQIDARTICDWGTQRRDMRGYVCVYVHTGKKGRRAAMDFPISRCLLVRASTLPPVGIILRSPVRSKPRSASLTLEVCAACLCTAVIYSLLERYGFSLDARCRWGRKWIRAGGRRAGRETRAKFVDFEPSERGEFVDIPPRHPMYREPSW